MHVRRLEIGSVQSARLELARIGVDPSGIGSTIPKQFHLTLKVVALSPELVKALGGLARGSGVYAAIGPDTPGAGGASAILSGSVEGLRILAGDLLARFGTGPEYDLAAGIERVIGASLEENRVLKTRSSAWTFGGRAVIMGILNVTPDSFYDGGIFTEKSRALERALEMREEGADLIDVGGESTRPGAAAVKEAEELRRVVPVVEALAGEGFPISIDTTKAAVARECLEAGAEIINDVSALEGDPGMAGVCAEYGAGVVLMHMRGTPRTMQNDVEYEDLAGEVYAYLASRLEYARERGIGADNTVVDPGIGFGKSAEGNLELIRQTPAFASLGRPVLVGASRKSFVEKVTGPGDRLPGTLAASVAAVLAGADIVRVHDVGETVRALRMIEALRGQAPAEGA